MKRAWNIIKKVLLALILLLVLLLVFTLDEVDEQPYFESEYYKNTIVQLDSSLSLMQEKQGQLRAGFARINITPQIGSEQEVAMQGQFREVPLAGYGAREKPANAVHDSIFAKAIALEVDHQAIVFIGTDLLIMPPAVAAEVSTTLAKKIGLKREQLYFGATHTHSSAGAMSQGWVGEQFAGVYQAAFVSWLSQQIVAVVEKALQDLQKASVGFSDFEAEAYVKNRIIGETGRLNDIFTFMVVKQDTAKTALLGAFAAHATTLGASNLAFSGDYPGYWERKLEKETVDLAVFFAGTVGSHSYRSKGNDFERAQYIGEALADSVKAYVPKVEWQDSVSFTAFSAPIQVPALQIRLGEESHLRSYLGHRLMPGLESPSIQGMKINNFIWMTLPCELSGEYAIDLKNALAQEGYHSVFSSFNGAYLGYIVPAKYYHYDHYESKLMGWYGPSMGDYLMELLYRSCNALSGERL